MSLSELIGQIMVKTRFAPSPTGYLHLGGARTALFAWLYAQANQGQFVLRVEDTDIQRSTRQATEAILEGMAWLGFQPDQPVVYQTQRFDRYQQVIDQLIAAGKAYRCNCSKERLEALRQEQLKNKEKPRYDGHCRHQHISQDEPCVIRFKNPNQGDVYWQDAVKGPISIGNDQLDDFIIQRTDKTPTYNFCVVIDDADMEITHVIRGDDHVNNTPRQINLYEALNMKPPTFGHVPMILGSDGKKMSKRHGAVSVVTYRDEGYLPQAFLNYLVRLGWSYGDQEIFSLDQLREIFDLSGINPAPSTFDLDKLNWINQYYMRHLPVDVVAKHLQWQFEQQQIDLNQGPALTDIIPVFSEKVKTLKALAQQAIYLYQDQLHDYDANAAKKHLTVQSKMTLETVKTAFENLPMDAWFDQTILHKQLKQTAVDLGIGMGKVGMPVRVAVTGSGHSPDIGLVLKWLGRQRVLDRLEQAIEKINKNCQND